MKDTESKIFQEIDQLLIGDNPIEAILLATTKLGWKFEDAIFRLPKRYEDLFREGKVEVSTKEYWKNIYS